MFVGAVDFGSIAVDTYELGIVEPKVLNTATLENQFADNRVIIVLNNKASLNFKDYSTKDFQEIECVAVQDLSTGKRKQVQEKVMSYKNSVSTMSAEGKATAVEEINKYNQIICLELAASGKENVLKAIKVLQARDDVLYAGPDYTMTLFSSTINDTHENDQWSINSIGLDKAWEITTGSLGVYVGVLDSGVNASHPDLQGQIVTSLSGNFVNGYMHSVPSDNLGHGTHVTGIIAAKRDNGQGIVGTASGVRIAALKVFPAHEPEYATAEEQNSFISMLIEALDYAEDMGIKILNLSGGLPQEKTAQPEALTQAIQNYSGLLVCAAGNSVESGIGDEEVEVGNNDVEPIYPASIAEDNILAVGASTSDDNGFCLSHWGITSVDVFAPGDYILSCYPTTQCQNNSCDNSASDYNIHHDNGYHYNSGTSMAAPYVTAIAALMLSENPSLTPLQIKTIIINTCTDNAALSDRCVSRGIVNAYHAVLNAHTHTNMTANSGRTASLTAGRSCWFKFTAPATGTYAFYTTGSQCTVGKMFCSTYGLLDSSNNTGTNFCLTRHMSAGQTVYLRVTLESSSASGSFVFYVE